MVVIKECFPTQKEFIIEYLEKRKQQIENLKQGQIQASCFPCYENIFVPFENPSDQFRTHDENADAKESTIQADISETTPTTEKEPNYIKNFSAFIQQTEQHLDKILATNQRINDIQDIVQDIQKPSPQITPINSILQIDHFNKLINNEQDSEYERNYFQENLTITDSTTSITTSTKEKVRVETKARKSESARNLKTLQQFVSRQLASNKNDDTTKYKLNSSLSATGQKLRKNVQEPITRIPSRSNSEKISLHYHGRGDSSARPNRYIRNENNSLSSRLPQSKEIRLQNNSATNIVYKNGAQTDRSFLTEKSRTLKLKRSFIEPVALPVSVINLKF